MASTVLLLVAVSLALVSAKLQWAVSPKDAVIDEVGLGVATANGDVFVSFQSNSPNPRYGDRNLTRHAINCRSDTFLMKIPKSTTDGTTVEWVVQVGAAGGDASSPLNLPSPVNNVFAVNDTIYLVGSFSGPVSVWQNSTTIYANLTNMGLRDVYLVVVNASSGVILSAKAYGGAGNELAYAVAVGSNGQVYITGSFSGVAVFGTKTVTSLGGSDIFLATLNATYDAISLHQLGTDGQSVEEGRALAIDELGGVWLTGYYSTATDPTFISLASLTSPADTLPQFSAATLNLGFLARFDSSLLLFNYFAIVGNNSQSTRIFDIVAINSTLWVTGDFLGSFTYPDRLGDVRASRGLSDIFVVKLTASSTSATSDWLTTTGGTTNDYARGISASWYNGDSFVTGSFSGTATFGNTAATAFGVGDAVVIRIFANGTVGDALNGGGRSASVDEFQSVVYSPVTDSVYATANFFGPTVSFAFKPTVATFSTVGDGNGDTALFRMTGCSIAAACNVNNTVTTLPNYYCGLADEHCLCLPGFSGTYCDINIDECASNPCQHGGTCVDEINAYSCVCVVGYNGTLCENDFFDECASNPCQHGATCTAPAGENMYNCSCAAGYNGIRCQTQFDNCYSSPCLNGGSCINGVNMFSCQCPSGSGFTGTLCQDTESSIFSIGNVAGGVAAAVVFLVFSIVCYFKCIKKDEKKAADQPTVSQVPMNSGGGNLNNPTMNNPGSPASLGVI